MRKLTVAVPTGNRTINNKTAVMIVVIAACSVCLWLGASRMGEESIAVMPSPVQVSSGEAPLPQRTRTDDPLEMEDQIVMTHAKLAKVVREAAAFQKFSHEIALATQDLDNSDAGVKGIVGRLSSLNACLSLTYFMAKDFFTGSSEVDTIFIAEVETLDRITHNSVNNAKQAIDRLQATLKMVEGSYTETYIAGPESRGLATRVPDEVLDGVSAPGLSQRELIKAISFDSSLGSASALLSATALAKTASRSAWNLLDSAKKKAVQRMAVAALPALADGPFPAGDVVALALESGCLAWSFYEVHEAQGTLSNDLQHELAGVMKQNSQHIHAWAMKVGNELMETAASSPPVTKVKREVKTHPRN